MGATDGWASRPYQLNDMLTISTFVNRSPIHGMGCFAGEFVKAGTTVWQRNEHVDCVIPAKHLLTPWQRTHAYKSTMDRATPLWILPRDNAVWINFAPYPNLIHGPVHADEQTLIAATDIHRGEELTVGFETDGDAEWKLGRLLEEVFNKAKENL